MLARGVARLRPGRRVRLREPGRLGRVSDRRARHPSERPGPRIERDDALWRLRSLAAARRLLRERDATAQAGFTAEFVPDRLFRHRPVLISDGPEHDERRRRLARFFAPAAVRERHLPELAESARRCAAEARAAGEVLLDELALHYTVEAAARIVGLTESSTSGTARRLTSFFAQPPLDLAKPGLGRTRRQWAAAAVNGLVPILRFYLADVRPAIRARRRAPRADVISHLLERGGTAPDILMECVTYGTAGMVTTREFICMAAVHLLESAELRERYTAAPREQRYAILAEIIRLEPVVGHLYRRVRRPIEVAEDGCAGRLAPGDLVDVCVRDANADERAVGPEPLELRPGRPTAPGVDAAGLSFGDGVHKCPGRALALAEADELLRALLRLRPVLVDRGELGWDDLIAGYRLRGVRLRFEGAAERPGRVERSSLSRAFDGAAAGYDAMTGLDPGYRRHLRRAAEALLATVRSREPLLLDLGCGTGLSTLALLRAARRRGMRPTIVGVDASAGMLAVARRRRWPAGARLVHERLEEGGAGGAPESAVRFVHARVEELPGLDLPPADGVLACYLLRNVPDPDRTLELIRRSLRPGAPFLALDYSVADSPAARRRWRRVHRLVITPLAAMLSREPGLYDYLGRSVEAFEGVRALAARLRRAGFEGVRRRTVPGWQRDVLHLLRGRAPRETCEPARAVR